MRGHRTNNSGAEPDAAAGGDTASTQREPTPPEGAPTTGHPDAADDPSTEIAELKRQVTELESRWRRALADADNLRKRHARELEQVRDRERARVAAAWLPVLDNLDSALEHAAADPNAIVEGVQAVSEQARTVLANLGFPRREDEPGTPFDPARHEAVGTLPAGEFAPGTIVGVVRSGYGDEQHVLRPTAVVVATEPR